MDIEGLWANKGLQDELILQCSANAGPEGAEHETGIQINTKERVPVSCPAPSGPAPDIKPCINRAPLRSESSSK